MEEIRLFENQRFGNVRILETDDGRVMFCGADVAKALGYSRPYDAIKAHCKCTVKYSIPHPQSPDKTIEMAFIPEPDVYRLTFGSKLPDAEDFTDWVVNEVLTSIRKNGAYMTPKTLAAACANAEFTAELLSVLQSEQNKNVKLESDNKILKITVDKQQEQIENDAPMVEFAKNLKKCAEKLTIQQTASLINSAMSKNTNFTPLSDKKLYSWLRDHGYLHSKQKNLKNQPTAKAIGFLVSVPIKSTTSYNTKVRVTHDGAQHFFAEMYREMQNKIKTESHAKALFSCKGS